MSEVEGVWLKVDGGIYGWKADKLCTHLRELIDAIEKAQFTYLVMEWQEANGGFGLIGYQTDPVKPQDRIPVIYSDTKTQ